MRIMQCRAWLLNPTCLGLAARENSKVLEAQSFLFVLLDTREIREGFKWLGVVGATASESNAQHTCFLCCSTIHI